MPHRQLPLLSESAIYEHDEWHSKTNYRTDLHYLGYVIWILDSPERKYITNISYFRPLVYQPNLISALLHKSSARKIPTVPAVRGVYGGHHQGGCRV